MMMRVFSKKKMHLLSNLSFETGLCNGFFKSLFVSIKGPLQYLFRPLLGKNEFAVTQHMYAFIGPNLDNIH